MQSSTAILLPSSDAAHNNTGSENLSDSIIKHSSFTINWLFYHFLVKMRIETFQHFFRILKQTNLHPYGDLCTFLHRPKKLQEIPHPHLHLSFVSLYHIFSITTSHFRTFIILFLDNNFSLLYLFSVSAACCHFRSKISLLF